MNWCVGVEEWVWGGQEEEGEEERDEIVALVTKQKNKK